MSDMYVVTCDEIRLGVVETSVIGVFDELNKAESAAQTWFDEYVYFEEFDDFEGTVVAVAKIAPRNTQWVLESGADAVWIMITRCVINEARTRPLTAAEQQRDEDGDMDDMSEYIDDMDASVYPPDEEATGE